MALPASPVARPPKAMSIENSTSAVSSEDTDRTSSSSATEIGSGYQALLDSAVEAVPVRITEARAYPVHAVEGEDDYDDIPEAVPLESIPAGVKKAPPLTTPSTSKSKGVRRVNALPQKRQLSVDELTTPSETTAPIDISKFVKMDEFREGKYRVKPLARVPGEEIEDAPVPRPKFMDGELPRSVERGLKHPQPKIVQFTAVLLILTKLLLLTTIIVCPFAMVAGREEFIKVAWIPISLFSVGLIFLIFARKCRCRVCSCHFFFVKRCFKHRNAHLVRILGYAGSAALHVLLFRWMRCMYCGTAIRMRIPKGEENLHT